MPDQPTRIEIPPEIEAEMTPAVKAFVISLIELQAQQLEALTKKCEALVGQVQTLTERSQTLADLVQKLTEKSQKSTPRYSSLPPSAVHPHGKPEPKKKPGKKRSKRSICPGG